MRRYVELLCAANSRARLTGPFDAETLWREHVLDAVRGLEHLPADAASFADVGTGGGLPGMVWAICRPAARALLIDSVGKKCAALESMARELECENVSVICARAEELVKVEGNPIRESLDAATARGVAHIGIVAEYLSPFVRVGGRVLAFKGPKVAEELRDIEPGAWSVLGLARPEPIEYSLETAGETKSLVVVKLEKISPCAKKFPRRTGLAESSPWWARGKSKKPKR